VRRAISSFIRLNPVRSCFIDVFCPLFLVDWGAAARVVWWEWADCGDRFIVDRFIVDQFICGPIIALGRAHPGRDWRVQSWRCSFQGG
jgi:hypothetical protein